jgi:membrane-bound lytic murein transglycosylase D
MPRPHHGLTTAAIVLALTTAACAAKAPSTAVPSAVLQTAPAPVPSVVVTPAPTDRVFDLIAKSTEYFEIAQRELQFGHLETARDGFNRALDVLLEWPVGARSEPRLREHFDRLVERISAYEVTALAQGDGFAERVLDPATIDDLLGISTFDSPAASPETTQAVVADLEVTVHDIEIPLNARVLSFIQLFTGRLKGYIEEGLSRGARYLPMIQEVFRSEGLPLDLAYVPLVESAFKPSALSRAKARGIWQFMRGTGLEMGLTHDWYIDERADAEKATRAAAKYLKSLHRTFGGDWHLALASYNGGPGRVQRALKRSGRDDFWSLSASTRYLPRETRDYVPLILAAAVIAKNPAQYGIQIVPMEGQKFETLTVAEAVDIRRIAEWAKIPVQTIQELNPELRRWTTPVRASEYRLRVPEGTADLVKVQMAQAEPAELASLNWHTVKKAETLASIAKRLKVSRTDLAEANYVSSRARVKPGARLIIPRPPALLLAARSEHPAPERAEAPTPDGVTVSNRDVEAPEPQPVTPPKLTHRVMRGDTLSSIARLYRTTVASLRQWNRISGNVIRVGQRLTILSRLNARTD